MCFNPMHLEKNDYSPTPCGRCYECKKRIVHAWGFRLMQEEKKSISANFITLTYATTNVPITKGGRLTLWKRDVQLFFKRLRKAHPPGTKQPSIKYFAVGEYGGRTARPHYHVILFNARIEKIQNAWQLGNVHYGTVDYASVYYTLKYVMKNPRKRKDSRQREFRLMSKGLGKSYVDKFGNYHRKAIKERMYLNLLDGKKIGMPRYYKDKIYNEEQREHVAIYGLQKAKELAEKDTRTYEEKQQAVLASFIFMDLQALARCTV